MVSYITHSCFQTCPTSLWLSRVLCDLISSFLLLPYFIGFMGSTWLVICKFGKFIFAVLYFQSTKLKKYFYLDHITDISHTQLISIALTLVLQWQSRYKSFSILYYCIILYDSKLNKNNTSLIQNFNRTQTLAVSFRISNRACYGHKAG